MLTSLPTQTAAVAPPAQRSVCAPWVCAVFALALIPTALWAAPAASTSPALGDPAAGFNGVRPPVPATATAAAWVDHSPLVLSPQLNFPLAVNPSPALDAAITPSAAAVLLPASPPPNATAAPRAAMGPSVMADLAGGASGLLRKGASGLAQGAQALVGGAASVAGGAGQIALGVASSAGDVVGGVVGGAGHLVGGVLGGAVGVVQGASDQLLGGANLLIDNAFGLLGVPYRRGGSSEATGFDCSGFVQTVYERTLGLVLPRSAAQQAAATQKIDFQDLKPGDLVFFNTMRRAFSHVGIYVGDGQFVHSPRTGAQVRVERMDIAYWKKRFNGARRVVGLEANEPAQR